MSNPEITATQPEKDIPADSTQETSLEDKLAIAEQRRRDTQAAFTKGQQTLKALEAEKAELLKQLENHTKISISAEDQEILDSLKYEDPDAWRVKMNSLESKAIGESRANIAELTGKAKEAAEYQFELERRQQVLKEFNDSAEVAITEELIANEVPPRITNKLAKGEISFEEFLSEVSKYVGTGKTIKNESTLGQPNMNNLGGGKTPTDMKPEKSLKDAYAGDIY